MVKLPLLLATSRTIFQRLDEVQRLRVAAALAILVVAAGLLVLFIRAWSRMVRWYMHPATTCSGRPISSDAPSAESSAPGWVPVSSSKPLQRLDRRPRVARNDRQHWGPRR